MASALQLNAQSTIINGHGLAPSPTLTTKVTAYQNLPTVKTLAAICSTITGTAGAREVLAPVLAGLASSNATFLLDMYPTGFSPVCTGSPNYLITLPVPIYGNQYDSETESYNIIGYSQAPVDGMGCVSKTLQVQAALPFANGLTGFANVFSTASAAASGSFETTSSINVLKDKTYGQGGLGFTGPVALATGGIGANGALIASVIKKWGTLFDIRKFSQPGDPYVFGQYLLNQNLGQYGLSTLFSAAGLNLGDLTKVPQSITTQTNEQSTATTTSYVGAVELPSVTTVTSTTTPTASSPAVMHDIYTKITGSDLTSILSATGFDPLIKLKTLDDYLTLTNLVDSVTASKLKQIGIVDFDTFGVYMQQIIGRGTFESWAKMAIFLESIVVPSLSTTATPGKDSKVLSDSAISTLQARNVAGSGELGQAVISDFIGACAGIPYVDCYTIIIDSAGSIGLNGVTSALSGLQSAVTAYINAGATTDPGTESVTWPTPTGVTSAVAQVKSALGSLSNSAPFYSSTVAYTRIVTQLATEVSNITKGHIVFNSGSTTMLNSFAQTIGSLATDSTQTQSYQFISNVTASDEYGDTIKSAIAETVNTNLLMSAGIVINNDPQPASALLQAKTLGISANTYISQNYG